MANGTVGSLITGKCPKCHQGKVFTHSFYNVMHYSQIHKSCLHCGVKFESELGFFWGAMYFSYALNVGVSIITGFSLFFFFNDPEYWVYISVIIPIMIILTPVMMRFSRLMMMYVVAPYRKFDKAAGIK